MGREVEPLRREVEVPGARWAVPTCPIAALAALLMLSWVSALSAPRRTTRSHTDRVRPCPERKAEARTPAPAPSASEYDCEFGELLDCNYGGVRR